MTPDRLPASQPLRPSAPPALPADGLDLDSQIEQVERRLVAREAWIRSTVGSLGQRAQLAATPRPWVLPVVGGGVILWLGWRWWHRRDPARLVSEAMPAPVVGRPGDGLANLPWAGLTAAVGWPLLPMAWRERFSPAAAAAIASTVLSIGRQLLRRRARRVLLRGGGPLT